MKKIWAVLALTLTAGCVTMPAEAAQGSFIANFGALAQGKSTTLSASHLFWSGAFSGAISTEGTAPFEHAFVTCPSSNDIDLKAGNNVITGYCLITDGTSSIVAKFSCDGPPGGCAGDAVWSDGTGKWAGLTAKAKFTAQLGKAFEDGSVPTYAIWHVDYTAP